MLPASIRQPSFREHLRGSARTLAFAVAALLSSVAMVVAQDKPEVVQNRQHMMSGLFADLGVVSAYVSGRVAQGRAQDAADGLVRTWSTMPELFPPGTSSTDLPGKTKAKPQIWNNRDEFVAANKTAEQEARKLADAVRSDDKAQAQILLGAISKDCNGACHQAFREQN